MIRETQIIAKGGVGETEGLLVQLGIISCWSPTVSLSIEASPRHIHPSKAVSLPQCGKLSRHFFFPFLGADPPSGSQTLLLRGYCRENTWQEVGTAHRSLNLSNTAEDCTSKLSIPETARKAPGGTQPYSHRADSERLRISRTA